MPVWEFTNVTKSATFWPTIESISITNNQPCQLAVLSALIVDVDADIDFDNKDELRVRYAEDGSTFVRIFAGDLNQSVLTDMGRSDPRVYRLTAQDYTKRLADNVIDEQRTVEESVTDRVEWIMGHSTQGISTDDVASISDLVDPRDYRGMSVHDALAEVAGEIGASFFVDFDLDLNFFVTPPVVSAPFDLAHPANEPTTYPFWDFSLSSNSDDYAEAVFVQGDGISVWRGVQGTYERAFSDSGIKTVRRAKRVGDRILADLSSPIRAVDLTLRKPGLVPGMTVGLEMPEWSIDEDFLVQSTEISALDPNGDEGGQLMMRVTLVDRFTPCYLRSPSASDLAREDTGEPTGDNVPCEECARKVVILPSGVDENLSMTTSAGGSVHLFDGTALYKYSCSLVAVDSKTGITVGLPYIRHEPGTHTAQTAGDTGLYGDPSVSDYGSERWDISDEIDPDSAHVTDRRTFWVAGSEL